MDNHSYDTNRHSCYTLKYHLVVVTKYRHPVITNDIFTTIKQIIDNIFTIKNKCKIICINYCNDHIHILFEAQPQTNLANLINNFKTVSSRIVRKEYAEFLKQYYWKPYFWSNSYFIGSVGDVTTAITEIYINNQKNK